MNVDIKVYEWNGHTWAGWWSDDKAKPTQYRNVDLCQRDRSQLNIGEVLSFDVPNHDDWSASEKGLDRRCIEGATIDFYSGTFTVEGFVYIERYGRDAEQADDEDMAIRRKQRWVVTLR